MLRATTACTFSSSQLPKVVRTWCVLYIVHFDLEMCFAPQRRSTSKIGPRMVCFVHFDFEMCFAPQRRALFRHRNFQKWSEPLVFFNILTSKCASRHNGVQLFISHLASWLRTRRFSEPTFQTLRSPKSLGKHSVSRLSYLFAHRHLLSSDTLSLLLFFLLIFLFSLPLPCSAFHLSILSEV